MISVGGGDGVGGRRDRKTTAAQGEKGVRERSGDRLVLTFSWCPAAQPGSTVLDVRQGPAEFRHENADLGRLVGCLSQWARMS